MKFLQLVKNLLNQIVSKILTQVSEELDGREKKAYVDNTVCLWLVNNTSNLGIVQKFVVSHYLIPIIPVISQTIYDCLKSKIKGLTENGKV